MKIASLHDFSMTYSQGDKKALSSINLDIEKGELLVICGSSGCGKSTLLLSLKKEVAPIGTTSGSIEHSIQSSDIGVVFQNCDSQLVTSTVINDLTFHMENQGLDNMTMKKRMAETVGFFGIERLLHKSPENLSGGQKQLVALCGAMMTQPKLLLLDEPISQLDPIAAKEFLDTLQRINEELGLTVIMTEHRLDDVLTIANRVVLMDNGKISYCGTPEDVVKEIWTTSDSKNAYFIPSLAKSALTISDGKTVAFTPRQFAKQFSERTSVKLINKQTCKAENLYKLAQAKSVIYKYPQSIEYVLKNLDLTLYKGELACIMGGNGSGKSTLLKALAGIIKPYMGKLKNNSKKIGYMPQNLSSFFTTDAVEDELSNTNDEIIELLGLHPIFKRHPYDISGGEQQRTALAAILQRKPDLILLDEPTKGLDPYYKTIASKLLKASGAAVLASTHDLEFAANCADRCMMLFDGDIAFSGAPHEFFSNNRYYTTEIAKAVGANAIKYEDVITLWEKEKPGFIAEY